MESYLEPDLAISRDNTARKTRVMSSILGTPVIDVETAMLLGDLSDDRVNAVAGAVRDQFGWSPLTASPKFWVNLVKHVLAADILVSRK